MRKKTYVPETKTLSSFFDTPANRHDRADEWVRKAQQEVLWVDFDSLVAGSPQVPSAENLLHALRIAKEFTDR